MIEDILIKNILKEARIYNHVGHETECNFLKKGKRKCSCEWGEYEEYLTKLIKKALTQVQEEAKSDVMKVVDNYDGLPLLKKELKD